MAPTLRPYQKEGGDRVVSAFLDSGQNRVLVKMPTGTGKTVLFAGLPTWDRLRPWLDGQERRGAFMLVIAHREELLRQAQAKIQAANPGLMVAIEQGDLHASRFADIVVASIQTLAARKYVRLERLLARHTFRIVVVDEAHHAAADSYRTTLAKLGFLPLADVSDSTEAEAVKFDDVDKMKAALIGWDDVAPKDRLLVGVTATPNRSDAIGLGCVFQTIAYSYGLKQAIDDGYLVPIKPWVVETAESLDGVHIARGDFKQNELADAVNTARRNRLAVDSWAHYSGKVPSLGFTVDVQHAHDLAAEFQRAGYRWQALSGETPKEERAIMLRQIQEGGLDGIANCMVLTEGTDLPVVGCILHTKPTKSATLYEQMTGRGLRPFPGKSECVVIDLVDLARRHSLQAAPVLYGLPPNLKTEGQDLQALADALDELREKLPNLDELLESGRFSLEELRDRVSTFDVFRVPDLGELAGVVSMNWIRSGLDTFRVGYPWGDGTETLIVSPDMLGKFTVATSLRPHVTGAGGEAYPYARRNGGQAVPLPATRQQTIAADIVGAAAALAVAEAFVTDHRRSVLKLKAKDAPWRARPASDKQIGYLRKLKIPIKPGISMGEASDAIDNFNALRGR